MIIGGTSSGPSISERLNVEEIDTTEPSTEVSGWRTAEVPPFQHVGPIHSPSQKRRSPRYRFYLHSLDPFTGRFAPATILLCASFLKSCVTKSAIDWLYASTACNLLLPKIDTILRLWLQIRAIERTFL